MARTELQDRSSARIDSGKIDEFAATLAGRLIRPTDPDYDAARSIWNAAIDRHPGLIVRCLGVADVVQAVKFAGRTISSSRCAAAATTSPAARSATTAL